MAEAKKVDCKQASEVIRRIAGWTFAELVHYYFGEASIVLKDKRMGSEELIICFTIKWLKANHVTQFGVDYYLALASNHHVQQCNSPECEEAKKMYNVIGPYLESVSIPGGDDVSLLGLCTPKRQGEKAVLCSENGWTESIAALKPFFLWFMGENKNFWIWPEENEAESKLSFDPASVGSS